MGPVFISYRREDTQGQARALFQDLVAKLGRDAVFMDVDSIALGKDFREVLQERRSSSTPAAPSPRPPADRPAGAVRSATATAARPGSTRA